MMEDGDIYLRLCMRKYAAQQNLDEYHRERLMKAANEKPGPVGVIGQLGQALMRLEKRLNYTPTKLVD